MQRNRSVGEFFQCTLNKETPVLPFALYGESLKRTQSI